MGIASGTLGIEEDSDRAIFTNVDLESVVGKNKDLKSRLPFIIPDLGGMDWQSDLL